MTYVRLRRCDRQSIALSLILGCLVISLLACEPWPIVAYHNETPERLLVYQDGEYQFDLQPGETRRFNMTEEVWSTDLRVLNEQGVIVLDEEITWEEVERRDFKIVIEGQVTSPEDKQQPIKDPSSASR